MSSGPLQDITGAAERAEAIAQRLEGMLGPGRVHRAPGVAIYDVQTPVSVRPVDVRQLSAVLALAHEEGLAACVVGGGTKLGWGNRPGRLDLVISTRGLSGFSHIDADNLSLSVRAGTTVAEACAQARAINRVLPLDPSHPGTATVGGVVATGDQGARGAGYGGLRDVVLGLSAVLPDGSPVKFGGRTMKNVSGYDMTKLFIGSFGVLGVVTDVTFRLLPRYETQALMVLPLASLDQGREMTAQILDSYLQPLALEVVSSGFFARACATDIVARTGGAGSTIPRDAPVMLAGFAGQRAAVARSVDEVNERYAVEPLAVLERDEAESLYEALADVDAGTGAVTSAVPALETPVWARITTPLSRVWELARSAQETARARSLTLEYRIGAYRGTLDLLVGRGASLGLGSEPEAAAESGPGARSDTEAATSDGATPDGATPRALIQERVTPDGVTPEAPDGGLTAFLTDLRREAEASGGALSVRDGLTWLMPGFDAWGESGSSIQIQKRIKERFDPHGILNPGRFVGGI